MKQNNKINHGISDKSDTDNLDIDQQDIIIGQPKCSDHGSD